MKRLAVLASGNGTLIQAIHEQVPITLLIVDRYCKATRIAAQLGMSIVLEERGACREDHALRLRARLDEYGIQMVAMAGFRSIVHECFLLGREESVLNVHPSLLPKYPGAKAIEQAVDKGECFTGCTVHHVSNMCDGGPVIAQVRVPILERDTIDALRIRIQEEEKALYPAIIRQMCG